MANLSNYWEHLEGVAPIKLDHITPSWQTKISGLLNKNSEDETSSKKPKLDINEQEETSQEAVTATEKEKDNNTDLKPTNNKKSSKRQRERGQNKAKERTTRNFDIDEVKVCVYTSRGIECRRDVCKTSHDVKEYLASKKPDVSTEFPCPYFNTFGLCPYGYRCRLLSSHSKSCPPESSSFQNCGLELLYDLQKLRSVLKDKFDFDIEQILNETQYNSVQSDSYEYWIMWLLDYRGQRNYVSSDVQKEIRSGFDFPLSTEYLRCINELNDKPKVVTSKKENIPAVTKPVQSSINGGDNNDDDEMEDDGTTLNAPPQPHKSTFIPPPRSDDGDDDVDQTYDRNKAAPDALLRPAEKKRLDFAGKLYLAPLTTVGNLPFRRLCGSLGSDIHCSEMAMGSELLAGNQSEWSLVRRHADEKIFGIQICGSRPEGLCQTAEALVKTCSSFDFLDLNLGCPIDLVFKKGAGSAMMQHAGRLSKSLVGMSKILGDTPLTIKMRTGVKDGQYLAHKLATKAQNDWGLGAVTIHGRSRAQRYTKLADYEYLRQCVQHVRNAEKDEDITPIPIFGNGDAYDYRTYWENVDYTGVDGIMIARGALIKPWIFTEIKERRDWDISSKERLDMIRQLCDYGLEHWGSDTVGVNHTRRYVCEALSFQHRYIPVGLLERLPSRMNDRPYPYYGRDDMETLLASTNSDDWVKISSMFLGPPPDGWKFTPKHKSNAYTTDEMNG